MKIVFQDSNFAAVEKEAGILSVPGRDPKDTRPILGRLLEKELAIPIFPIHRLDAEVSGLVVYALNPDAHRAANVEFENRRVKKTYQAISFGGAFADGDRGTWKAKILRGKKRAYESPAGKLAVTDFEVAGRREDGAIEWRLNPQTGRSHQLRWELYRHESPILGDALYGSDRPWKEGIALRSLELEFSTAFADLWKLPPRIGIAPFELY